MDVNTVMQPGLDKQPAPTLYFSSQSPWWSTKMTTHSFLPAQKWSQLKMRGALSSFRPLGQTWQRNDRKSQKGTNLPFWHVCLTVCPTSQYWGHFLLTSPPLVTAGWAARNIPCLGFLLFCFGLVSNTGTLHRCNLTYSHHERKTNLPKHPQRHQKMSRKCEVQRNCSETQCRKWVWWSVHNV